MFLFKKLKNALHHHHEKKMLRPHASEMLPVYTNEAQLIHGGQAVKLERITQQNLRYLRSAAFAKRYQHLNINGSNVISNLTTLFTQYNIPIGIINALMIMTRYFQHLVVDDSYSMNSRTDVKVAQAYPLVRAKIDPNGKRARHDKYMTRWEELQSRMHMAIDVMAQLPIPGITIDFLNRGQVVLERGNKTSAEFAAEAHKILFEKYSWAPGDHDKTPIFSVLSRAYDDAYKKGPTMVHIYTDGEPTDASVDELVRLITTRQFAMTPTSINSCTDKDQKVEWAKKIEKMVGVFFTSEVDDACKESLEVAENQGYYFPYSDGLWLIQQLLGAVLKLIDNLDENEMYTKAEYDLLHGVESPYEVYKKYFDSHTQANYCDFNLYFNKPLDPELVALCSGYLDDPEYMASMESPSGYSQQIDFYPSTQSVSYSVPAPTTLMTLPSPYDTYAQPSSVTGRPLPENDFFSTAINCIDQQPAGGYTQIPLVSYQYYPQPSQIPQQQVGFQPQHLPQQQQAGYPPQTSFYNTTSPTLYSSQQRQIAQGRPLLPGQQVFDTVNVRQDYPPSGNRM